jgi:hypothetical protein
MSYAGRIKLRTAALQAAFDEIAKADANRLEDICTRATAIVIQSKYKKRPELAADAALIARRADVRLAALKASRS